MGNRTEPKNNITLFFAFPHPANRETEHGQNFTSPSSLLQAIDVWMGACTAFIFAALIEFTVVNYLWRKQKLGYTLNQQGIDFSDSDNEEEAIELEQVSFYS